MSKRHRHAIASLNALCEQLSLLAASASESLNTHPLQSKEWHSCFILLQTCTELIRRLIAYGAPPLHPPTVESTNRISSALRKLEKLKPSIDLNQAHRDMLRPPRGRPQTTRHLAARALREHELHRRYTWAQIAERLKPANYPAYGEPFADRLRRDVRRLKNIIREAEEFLHFRHTSS